LGESEKGLEHCLKVNTIKLTAEYAEHAETGKGKYSVDHEIKILEDYQARLRSHEFIRCTCQERALKTERMNS
jgi:hypothetical protein